ncbi:MAG: class I SAM-dependent methyltransferase [Proteobacteria bacterium]|nr:class I SAM-dependent methyltransferase [Pseudomonadota bacterium]
MESLLALVALLSSWSIRMNLTGHREPGRALRGLVLESVALLGVLPSFRSAVDLGSGAGFPGLPWAILHPERRVVLVESRERRHHFQRAAIRQLGLSNVVSLRGRLEELDPEPVDAVVAQAVGPARSIIPMMLPWARLGGFVAIPCGPNPPEIGQVAGLGEAHFLPYRVPLGGPARGVWIADRDS